jgi:predicted  nucleic acid-binding Zn-ribbon protein
MVKSSIKSVLAQIVVDGIQYEKLAEEVYELREFQRDSEEEVERFVDRLYEVQDKQKSVTDKLALDSATEEQFAKYLDNLEDVKTIPQTSCKNLLYRHLLVITIPTGLSSKKSTDMKKFTWCAKLRMVANAIQN